MGSLISLPSKTVDALVFLSIHIRTDTHTRSQKHVHTPCVTYGLPVLSTAAWGNGTRLSLSPTSQLNIEPEGKCSTRRDNHDHTQSNWKVVYRQDSLDYRLRRRCNVTYRLCATGTSCLLSHTRAYTDEHWQTRLCNYAHTYAKLNKSWAPIHFRPADSSMQQLFFSKNRL